MVLDCLKEAGRCGLPLIYKAKQMAEVPQQGINGNPALLPLFLLLAAITSNTVTMQGQPNPCSAVYQPISPLHNLSPRNSPTSKFIVSYDQSRLGVAGIARTHSKQLSVLLPAFFYLKEG